MHKDILSLNTHSRTHAFSVSPLDLMKPLKVRTHVTKSTKFEVSGLELDNSQIKHDTILTPYTQNPPHTLLLPDGTSFSLNVAKMHDTLPVY